MKQSDSVGSRLLLIRVSLIATLLALVNCSGPDGEKVESGGEVTLIVNADIVTINEGQPSAEAMAVQDGRIIALGSLAEVRGAISGYDKFFDLEGRTVVPGFIETHDHLFMGSATSQIENISPFSTPTLSEALEKLSTIKPDQEGWVVAHKPNPTPTLAAAIAASDARAAKGITTSSELAIMNAFVLNGLSKATSDPNFATRMVGGYFSTASDFDEIVPLLPHYENDLLTIRFIKTWTDGSPQGGTANLRDGYYDPTMGSGGTQGVHHPCSLSVRLG
jgi:predicted amidohydrolase YtcJ